MNIGETVQVPAVTYVEVEVSGNNYRRYSADHWVWQIGESDEHIGPNETADLEKTYQNLLYVQKQSAKWEQDAIARQERTQPSYLEEMAKNVGRKTSQFKDNLAYSLLPEDLQYDRDGDMQDKTVIAAQKWLQERNMQLLFAPSVNHEDGPFQLVLNGKIKGEGYMGWKENVYVCEFFPVEDIPTRPSEDDMMSKPTHDQHPQFRDIGVRIDRYGKIVFKPELVE